MTPPFLGKCSGKFDGYENMILETLDVLLMQLDHVSCTLTISDLSKAGGRKLEKGAGGTSKIADKADEGDNDDAQPLIF